MEDLRKNLSADWIDQTLRLELRNWFRVSFLQKDFQEDDDPKKT